MSEENVTPTSGESPSGNVTEQVSESSNGAGVSNEAPSFVDSIPESYREKGYMKGVDSMDTLLGKLDNAEKLKGSKNYLPSDDADDNTKSEFKNMLQDKGYLPKVPEKYEFVEIEGVQVPEGVTEKVGEIFKEAGLSQEQADKVRSDWIQHEMILQNERIEKADKEFVELAEEEWGSNWNESMADVTMHLKEHLPAEYKDSLQNLPSSLLVPMLKAVSTALGTKESPDGAPSQSSVANMDGTSIRDKFNQLRKAAATTGKKGDVQAFNDFQQQNRAAIAKAFGRS